MVEQTARKGTIRVEASVNSDATLGEVRLRKVFYIPGFDPAPPRRYRELYRREAKAQAAISGYAIDVAARHGSGSFGWVVTTSLNGQDVRTEFEVLVWSDIVRASMGGGIVITYLQMVRTAWIYLSSGALFRLMRLRKGPVIAALYPIFMLLVELALAGMVFWLVSGLSAFCLERLSGAIYGPSLFEPWFVQSHYLSLAIGVVAGALVLRWFKRNDHRIFAYYLMQDYAFTARLRGDYSPELEQRLAMFGGLITKALQSDCNEVLVVGHSSGAHLGVSILADILRAGLPKPLPSLGFLSLGQVVPMVSFLPKAHRLRGDLHYLCARDELTWVDVTAPGDGCAFALCDPVSVTGVAAPGKRWPLVMSAAFTKTLSPARWKVLRWRFFRLHFQYLCAFDRPGIYDYFRITAGPQTLADRFAGCAPSKSRIETPASAYTSICK